MRKKVPVPPAPDPNEALADDYRTLVLARTGLTRETLQCPRERSDMTPCVARDGGLAVAYMHEKPICVGCEAFLHPLMEDEQRKYTSPKGPTVTTPATGQGKWQVSRELPNRGRWLVHREGPDRPEQAFFDTESEAQLEAIRRNFPGAIPPEATVVEAFVNGERVYPGATPLRRELYRSTDDGQFYRARDIDDVSRFERWEVNTTVVVQSDDLCGNNDLGELLLLRTGQGRHVK